MNGSLTRMLIKIREYRRGQTMTEYALILAAVATVVFRIEIALTRS